MAINKATAPGDVIILEGEVTNAAMVLRHGRDVHPTWVKLFTKTLGSVFDRFCSTRAKSKEDFDSY